jgi:hypothetical protein
MGDVALLHSYVGHPGKYRLCCESSTPVTAEPFGPTETASIGFAPLHSSAPFSQTVRTEIHVNAARFKAGQIGFTYDPACADVVEWTRNSADFPMGTWDSDTIGEEWLTFSANEALTGTYSIGSLVLHCVSEEACTTALVFLKEGTRASKLFDDWGSEISATWTDGAFSKGYNVHLPITLSGNAY